MNKNNQKRSIDNKSNIAACSSAIALCLAALPAAVFAQDASGPVNEEASSGQGDIIVTGSRLARSGFNSPTPTTVVGAASIEQRAQTTATDVLIDIPAFRATATASTGGPGLGRGAATADLRGLGAMRTLLLIDGQRAIPTTASGTSDLNLIPALMIDRVEVVTGGASASYGSDAIAGVVNIILKKNYEGLTMQALQGITSHGDNRQMQFSALAGKSFAGGRGHIVVGGEYDKSNGIYDPFERDWGSTSTYTFNNGCAGVAGTPLAPSLGCPGNVANGLPQRLIVPNVYAANYFSGGVITAVSGGAPSSLIGTKFAVGGEPGRFPVGSLSSSTLFVTDQPTDALPPTKDLSLVVPVKRYNAMLRAEYELSDALTVHAGAIYARSSVSTTSFPLRASNTNALTIRGDNAFLRSIDALQPIAALMPNDPSASFRLGREINDGQGMAMTHNRNTTYNFTVGAAGKLGGGWAWDANAQLGENKFRQISPGQVVASRIHKATDAVFHNGQIVCRVNADAITTNDDAACVAYNPFGSGSPSADADNYIRSTAMTNLKIKQRTVDLTVRGDLFSTWAGPVSVAFGGEYRHLSADQTVDELARTNAYLATTSNQKPLTGSYNVKEIFGEIAIPLLKDSAIGEALDINAAGRRTDYSTSGAVTTWKLGAVYKPIPDIMLRYTRSRDIRAPNIAELFTQSIPSNPTVLTNPFQNNAPVGQITAETRGNINLKPEIANGMTVGAVLQPRFIPRFSLSVDYYNIKVKGAISSLSNQNIINRCYAGYQAVCDQITFGPNQSITYLVNQSLNFAAYKVRGIEVEGAYRLPLEEIGNLPGVLDLNVIGSNAIDIIFDDSIVGPINYAGQVSNLSMGRPKWSVNTNLLYTVGGLSAGVTVRYINKAKYDNTFAEGVDGVPSFGGATINNNRIPSRTYVNLNASYKIPMGGKQSFELFGVVNNLFDKDPPFAATGASATNPAIYDVIGRAFKIGVRVKY